MIRLTVAIGFVCGGCNRSEADVVQNAHGDAKPPPILSPVRKKKRNCSCGFFRSVMWGCSCRGRWGMSWGETNLTLQGLGEGRGVTVYFIRWVDAGLLHAVRQVGLAVFRTWAVWVLTAACEEEAVVVGSSQTSPGAPWGIVDSEASATLCTPCEGQDWGGDTRQLCRCLRGRQKK